MVTQDALLVGLDPDLGTASMLRERTNFGRGCSFSFFIDVSLYDKTIREDMDLVKRADKNVP